MIRSKKEKQTFYQEFLKIYNEVSNDSMKNDIYDIYPMAYLAKYFKLKKYVQLGIDNGTSFLSMAYTFTHNKGVSLGITNDFNDTSYSNVVLLKERFKLSRFSYIISDSELEEEIGSDIASIDMLNINSNFIKEDIEDNLDKYLKLLNENGFLVFTNLDSIYKDVIINYKEKNNSGQTMQMIPVINTDNFNLFMKTTETTKQLNEINIIKKKLEHLRSKLHNVEDVIDEKVTSVLVGILTYNHEKYIKECIDSVLMQEGSFKLKVVIINDCSTDNSNEIIKRVIESNKKDNIEIEYFYYEKNKGLIENLKTIVHLARDYDYLTFCEGDDYWISSDRIATHIDFLKNHPEVGVSFNSIKLYYNDTQEMKSFDYQESLAEGIYQCESLISFNYIGNFSCCFYDGTLMHKIPDGLFDMFTVDWMFNIYCATMSDIGYIKSDMTVYRKHSEGVWTGLGRINSTKKLIGYIDQYNKFTNFDYDRYFCETRELTLIKENNQYTESANLIIIDDIFPSALSGFRYQEFTSYLEHIEGTKILTTGITLPALGEKSVYEIIMDYKRKHPEFGDKVICFDGVWKPIECKLLYFTFLNNVYSCLKFAEENKIPFVFTLYPGGGFAIDNKDSNRVLNRVFKSPCFRKVIVTQKITYDYLINNKFCPREKIEFIFGVVTPLEKIEKAKKLNKRNYGVDKDKLDVCFVAHKYTPYGEDKGYDVFVDVAKQLTKKHNNIYFHVVGSFDENVLDVSEIKDRIIFYGQRDQEWLDNFFDDKDIILSPNIHDKIFKGSFDGFPTASCTDAGLKKVAIFCTDELKLNQGRFIDNEDIVIIPHNSAEIVKIIESFLKNPKKLKDIGEKGQEKIIRLYNFEAQIEPRIKILKEESGKPLILTEEDIRKLNKLPLKQKVKNFAKKYGPKWLKNLYHKLK